MKSQLCNKLGIEFPLFAFSHCRDVVAAVSNAGGFGVLGAVMHSPATLEVELQWIDEHVAGKPYGIDLLIPNNMEDKDSAVTDDELRARIPPEHIKYVNGLMQQYGIETDDLWSGDYDNRDSNGMREAGAARLLDVAFKHPIKLFVNALGVPPPSIMQRARANGVLVGALAGAKEHAIKHAEAGVDLVVVSGTEAGGHCGEVSTMVVLPEVLQALDAYQDIAVLAAGGIASGKQMAACMAMGAAGVWTGSVWLTTVEAETTPTIKAKMLQATSRDTVRSRSRTGKPTRQLRSAWSDAWRAPDAPDPLPMPLQGLLSRPPMAKVDKLAAGGHAGAQALAAYYVGQAVGLMNSEQSARSVVHEFMQDYVDAVERLSATI
ncbi:MAG: NAD(P)H-dependent flavin oxidoreductase YrpB (nitropropane dioxygenase family) [Gammaproteobacteria bacterium]|jgi:NAD(P)H-dependent flavin oxidoreductase YrpB (nitropropane dioxygenase family)